MSKHSVFTWLGALVVFAALVNSAALSWQVSKTRELSVQSKYASLQNLTFNCARKKFAAETVAGDIKVLKSTTGDIYGVPRAVYEQRAQRNVEFLEVFKLLDCSSVGK